MKEQIWVLRTEPLLQFQFLENGFQFTDDSESNTSQFFEYRNISKLDAREKSTNWWLTIVDFFVGILFQAGGEIQKEGRQIRFEYSKQLIILLLNNCDWEKIIKTREFISSRL